MISLVESCHFQSRPPLILSGPILICPGLYLVRPTKHPLIALSSHKYIAFMASYRPTSQSSQYSLENPKLKSSVFSDLIVTLIKVMKGRYSNPTYGTINTTP